MTGLASSRAQLSQASLRHRRAASGIAAAVVAMAATLMFAVPAGAELPRDDNPIAIKVQANTIDS